MMTTGVGRMRRSRHPALSARGRAEAWASASDQSTGPTKVFEAVDSALNARSCIVPPVGTRQECLTSWPLISFHYV